MRKQETNPNLNAGGNDGNAFGAGRTKKAFRAKAARAANEIIEFWVKVAKGNKVIPTYDHGGRADGFRYPTFRERKETTVDILLRFGIGTQDEVIVLGNMDVLNALADVLTEFIDDAEKVDAILVAVESRVGGQGS